jgi:hypothetical protein
VLRNGFGFVRLVIRVLRTVLGSKGSPLEPVKCVLKRVYTEKNRMDELETAKTHEPLLQIRLGFVAPASEKTKNHLKHIRWQEPLLVEDEEAQGNWKVLMGASPLHDHLGALIFFVYFFLCAQHGVA